MADYLFRVVRGNPDETEMAAIQLALELKLKEATDAQTAERNAYGTPLEHFNSAAFRSITYF
ncbi:acyl-CoA carboxylase subunit epsilon [Corynebacterium caspium]|uniref:acyl-CoA carboxylase subunit epsilon n=1 Tax=Corynebacterium caspium TaxID=234828 RepID=UPI0003618A1D|nr:acyl-CoA carboxylase subunit epsilon [Corynebacterium caspium]WKD59739.1 hypothetical protein CCASP_06800 [Corynebacterium caspium DSM 44850]